ncbi:MAG: TonB-dependent receptor [Nitrospira sp.]|nr:TonB-dependent receptor [Nitrospira sp.]
MSYRNLLLTGLIIGVLAPGVSGQESDPTEAVTRLKEIVVIGSRIEGRSITDSPVPVDLIKGKDMLNTGQLEVGRAIQRLIPSFNFSSSSISDGTDALRPATLRGMGPDQVLVLLNGKRRHGSALIHVNRSVGRGTAGTDMNAIPMGAIKRIEVLRDGASAQYGSDAIAGVINVVLKDDYEGGFRTNYGTTYKGDGDQFVASLDKGFKVGQDGTLHTTFEYRNRQRTNRAGLFGIPNYPGTTCRLNECTDTQLPNKAALIASNPNNPHVILDNPNSDLDERERNFNRRNFRVGDSASEQFSGALNFDKSLGKGLEFYSFADVSRRANESGGFWRQGNSDKDNPPFGNPPVRVYPDGFLPLINSTIWDYSFGAGVVKEFNNGLRADLGVVHGGNTFNFNITNSHNASWVAANQRSGATSADAGTLELYLTTVNLDFSLPIPDKNMNLAWGAAYRRDNYQIQAGEEYSYADYDGSGGGDAGIEVFTGFKPENEVNESRHAFSFYTDAEMFVDNLGVFDQVMVSPAVRYEHYSDFGHTINGKLATKLDFSRALAVRGSMSSGFRAPSMQQLYFNNISTQFVTGQADSIQVGTFRNDSAVARAIGIPELKQEIATNLSVGLVYQPTSSFTLTADVYRIEVKDRIILSGFLKPTDPALSDSVIAALNNAGAGSAQFFMNAADTETRGGEIVASWNVPFIDRGNLDLNFLGALMQTQIRDVKLPAGLPSSLFDDRERSIIEEWQPRSRFTLSGLYQLDQLSASVMVHRYGSYTVSGDGNNPPKQKFDPQYVTDVQFSYNFGPFGILKLGANNVFDVTPDEDTIDGARGGTIIDSQGNLIVDSPDVFTYSRRSAPFGFNGGFYYAAFEYRF